MYNQIIYSKLIKFQLFFRYESYKYNLSTLSNLLLMTRAEHSVNFDIIFL